LSRRLEKFRFAHNRFSLKRSDGTWAHSDSEIAEVFADVLENRFTPPDHRHSWPVEGFRRHFGSVGSRFIIGGD